MDDQALRDAPLRRILQAQLTRLQRMDRDLDSPAAHVDAKRHPAAFSCLYGPIGMQTARRYGTVGFEALATLVNPGAYIVPIGHNAMVGQYGPFYWCATEMFSDLSWTYTSDTGFALPYTALPAAGLYDAAIARNGGAVILNNFGGTAQFASAPVAPRLAVEIDIYDKTRGRSITGGRVSPETFTGLNYGAKKVPNPIRWEHGTEIEPRIYVTECRMSALLDDAADTTFYEKSSVAAWLTVVFKGYTVPR